MLAFNKSWEWASELFYMFEKYEKTISFQNDKIKQQYKTGTPIQNTLADK